VRGAAGVAVGGEVRVDVLLVGRDHELDGSARTRESRRELERVVEQRLLTAGEDLGRGEAGDVGELR
jgi:hypothetical protein